LKKYSRLFTISALVLGGLVSANATPILIGSYGTSATNPGYANTATIYDPLASTVNSGSDNTFDISPGSIWHPAIGSSSWVSYSPLTGPTSSLVAPNGDYIYTTTFTISPKDVADVGTLTVLADDTVSVFLNNSLILQSAGPMGPSNSYAMCSDVGPNCLTPLTFSFTGITTGLNELTFDVKQVNLVNEGLDFSGSLDDAAVPEPLSLILFGTGLIGLVGLSRRYVNAS
jgi:PEP-CTERM motif-containing protein